MTLIVYFMQPVDMFTFDKICMYTNWFLLMLHQMIEQLHGDFTLRYHECRLVLLLSILNQGRSHKVFSGLWDIIL